MVLNNLTAVGKIGLVLLLIGACFFVVAFAVPYWVYYTWTGYNRRNQHVQLNSDFGLWQYCPEHAHGCASTLAGSRADTSFLDSDWYRGTQALACLALIALIIDFVILFLFICGKPRKFLLISVVLDFVTAALAILAAVVFGSEMNKYLNMNLNWGFAFDIIGGIFIAGAAACFLLEFCRRR